MIVEYLRYTIEKANQTSFIDDYKKGAVPLKKSKYCQSLEFCQCVEDSSKFIIRIQWSSADDHLKGFRGSQEFKEFFTHIKKYIDDIDEMRHYSVVE